MKVLEITNYYSQNLEQISISLDKGETMILLGSSAKKDIINGILNLQKCKMGEIFLETGHRTRKLPPVIFADAFSPSHIPPVKWERLYVSFCGGFCVKTYHSYLEKLNLSENIPVVEEWERYKLATALALSQKSDIILIELPDLDEKEEINPWKQAMRDCRRIIQEKNTAKIINAPSLSALENWKLDACKISIFSEKKLLCNLPYEDIKLEKITCSFQEWKEIATKDYVWKYAERDSVTLIFQNSSEILQKRNDLHIEPCSLGEFLQKIQEEENDLQ